MVTDSFLLKSQVKCQAGYRRDIGGISAIPPRIPGGNGGIPPHVVGSHLSHLRWKFDPTCDPTFNAGFLHPTREFKRDLCILPGILVGISISHLGFFIPPRILYPTYENIVLLFLFLQNNLVRVPILMDHPHSPQIFGMETRQRWSLFP